MANINSSLDEILTELGDSFDADIAPRKIVRSTGNKIWLMLRAFSRGLYSLHQVVAALKYRFDPLYCTEEELESTMRITGQSLRPGKASLLSIVIENTHILDPKTLPTGTYFFDSANGVTFMLVLQEDTIIQPNTFIIKDFFSSIGEEPLIGSYPVSENTGITVYNSDPEVVLDIDIVFGCLENSTQLGYPGETLYEFRQRVLTDSKRQEILHILEENLQKLPNVHECTVIGNNTFAPVDSSYMQDDGVTPVQILPQSLLVVMTGSPTVDFAKEFVSLSPFLTTLPVGVAKAGTVYYPSTMYADGQLPVHYIPHRIVYYDIVVQYGYTEQNVSVSTIESRLFDTLFFFKITNKVKSLLSADDFIDALRTYQNPAVKLLSVSFSYDGDTLTYMRFDKTQIARLQNITFIRAAI